MKIQKGCMAVTHGAPMDNGLVVDVGGKVRRQYAGMTLWHVRSRGSKFQIEPNLRSMYAMWPEQMLKPIANPGDQEPDQSAAWLPAVPTTETAAA